MSGSQDQLHQATIYRDPANTVSAPYTLFGEKANDPGSLGQLTAAIF